jgi:hypothetical protein
MGKRLMAGLTALLLVILLVILLDVALQWWAWFYHAKRLDLLELEVVAFLTGQK